MSCFSFTHRIIGQKNIIRVALASVFLLATQSLRAEVFNLPTDNHAIYDADGGGEKFFVPTPFGQTQLFQAFFEKVPGFQAALTITALGLGLIAAQENMPSGVETAQIVEHLRGKRDRFGRVLHNGGCGN